MYEESSKRRVYVHTCIRGGCHKSWGMTPGLPLLASLTSTILSDIFTIRIHVSTRDDIQSGGTAGPWEGMVSSISMDRRRDVP